MADIIASTYELAQQLGSGGGGVVYLANHLRLGKQVVLKADKRKITTKTELLRREVDVLKNLSHPYIPQVYDYFVENGVVYTVIDYVDGESLDRPLKRGERFSQPQVVKWARQLLEAVCYLHEPVHGNPPRGYVHGDIKPANIMCRLNGDICLIDFNIALAIGEESTVGASPGYASPEHYGLDFSTRGLGTETETAAMRGDETLTLPAAGSTPRTTSGRRVLPDERSDIYSIGATLYHLLSGRRPARSAEDVVPLTASEAGPQICAIIAKAMNPNPDLRYQTAKEMLYDFEHLHENDPRTLRHRRRVRTAAIALSAVFLLGGLCTFFGLRQQKREQETARIAAEAAEAAERAARLEAEQKEEQERLAKEAEQRAKDALALISNSRDALQSGDVSGATADALRALSLDTQYDAQAQKALTHALGIYDLSAGYKPYTALQLPSEPIKLALSPGVTRAAVLTSAQLNLFDLGTGEPLAQLDAHPSALSDVVFRGEDRVIYAASSGLAAYDLANGAAAWSGEAATGITLSGDGAAVAAVYRDAGRARVCDAETGTLIREIDFEGKQQRVLPNDVLTDPEDNLFLLDETGRWLAVSFSNGALWVYDMEDPERDIEVFDTSDYTRFEGGFSGHCFAFSAKGPEESVFIILDLDALAVSVSSASTSAFHVAADTGGIYLAMQNVLVAIDPVTASQTEMAYTASDILAFDVGADRVLVRTEDGTVSVFDRYANFLERFAEEERLDMMAQAGGMIALASLNKPQVRVLKQESHQDSLLFSYDPGYSHSEARVGNDGRRVMLYRFDAFRLYDINGAVLAEAGLPDPEQVYDQQFVRDAAGDRLEVIYNDGTVLRYAAEDGALLETIRGEPHDGTLREEFLTDRWRIESPLHGAPQVYDRNTGTLLGELEQDDYLTYVTQMADGSVMTEYVSVSDGARYGLLLDENMDVLARLPQLCDLLPDGTLVFDDTIGNLRTGRVLSAEELIALAGG